MFKFILKKSVPIPNLLKFDSFLFIGPHPDDIEVSSGATVARLAQLNKNITFVIATNGCVGSVDETLTSEELVHIRQMEALASANFLGAYDVRFLPHNDGCDYDLKQLTKDLAEIILEVRPQVVFCPDYTVRSECHPDHIAVGKAATDAVFYAGFEKLTNRMGLSGTVKNLTLAYYFTDKPNCYVGVRKTYKKHMEAIRMHKSQFTKQDLDSFRRYFSLRQIRFGLRSGKCRADGFRVLTPVRQHCFPEADEL